MLSGTHFLSYLNWVGVLGVKEVVGLKKVVGVYNKSEERLFSKTSYEKIYINRG